MLLAAAAVATLAQGRAPILVVPDDRDQAQLEAALAGGVPMGPLVRHDAGRESRGRYSGFLRTLGGVPCVAVGNGRGVTPLPDIGLVALWDDGDPLLGEPLTPVHPCAALVRQGSTAALSSGGPLYDRCGAAGAVGWVRAETARGANPRVVPSATGEGESWGSVCRRRFDAAREALRTGPCSCRWRHRVAPAPVAPNAGAPRAARLGRGPCKRPSRAVPDCGWCGRAANAWACPHAPRPACASRLHRATADELGRASRRRVMSRTVSILCCGSMRAPRSSSRREVPSRSPTAATCRHPPRRRADAARRRASDRRVVPPLVDERGGPRRARRTRAPRRRHRRGRRALATWTPATYARAELADRTPLRMPPAVRVATLEGPPKVVTAALSELREDAPELEPDGVLGPVAIGDDAVRALVRFDYARGARITESLRSSVVAAALRARKAARGRAPGARNTLRVRVDVPDLDL